jgi:5-methylcytosine-specific restriction endonuclease McrA
VAIIRRLMIRVAKEQRAKRHPCWLCGQAIDYTVVDGSTPESYTYDHIKPYSTHPHLAYDPTNGASAHRRCNQSRGNRTPERPIGRTSRDW